MVQEAVMRKRGVAIGHFPRPAAEEQKPEAKRQPPRRTPEPSGESHIRPTLPYWPEITYSGVSAVTPRRDPRLGRESLDGPATTGELRRSFRGMKVQTSPHIPRGQAYVVNGGTLMISDSDRAEFLRVADADESYMSYPRIDLSEDLAAKGAAVQERVEQASRAAAAGMISMQDLGRSMRDLMTWRDPWPEPEPEPEPSLPAPTLPNLDSRGRECYVVGVDGTQRRPMTVEEIAEMEDPRKSCWVLASTDANFGRNYIDLRRRS